MRSPAGIRSCRVCGLACSPNGAQGLCLKCHHEKLRARPYVCKTCGGGRYCGPVGRRGCLDCAKTREMAKRRRIGRPTKAEYDRARRKPPTPCRDCRVNLARQHGTRCNACTWKRYKHTIMRARVADASKRQRMEQQAAREDGDRRCCRGCGLWKRRDKHFSLTPGGGPTRRNKCVACYSRAQATRRKAAGIVHGYSHIDRDSWQHVVELAGGLCAYCRVTPWKDREHIIPVTKGGPTELWNLTIACRRCNLQKKNLPGWFPKVLHPWMKPEAEYQWWMRKES